MSVSNPNSNVPAATATPSPVARDARETLLAAATQIFSERGYEAATIKEITDRAGVNVASVNYYFRDKLGLYTEVLRQGLSKARITLPPGSDRLEPEQRLLAFIQAFLDAILSARDSGCAGIMTREIAQPTSALPQLIEEILRPNLMLLRQIVEDIAGQRLDDTTLSLLTHGIHAQCVHWKNARSIFPYLWPSLQFDETQLRRIATHIATFSIAGIRACAAAQLSAPAASGQSARPA